VELWLLLEGA
jgi:hypothetical protein